MCLFGGPAAPDPPPLPAPAPKPPRLPDDEVQVAGQDERRRARAAAGYAQTIKTGQAPLGPAATAAKQLLGA